MVQLAIKDSLQSENEQLVEVVAYCIMQTHFHLILKQVTEDGIAKFMGRILNGYSRYFNSLHSRVGPLWTGRFKNVLIRNDEHLLHLTRYIHLNPVSAGLVTKPEDWDYSSYK
jgi:putative transposase